MKRDQAGHKIGDEEIINVHGEEDLGVTIKDSQQSEKHVGKIFRATYRMVRNIGTAFDYMDENMRKEITTVIRPKLEYTETVWSPFKKECVHKLERMQRIAMKFVPELAGLQYEDRLREIDLPTF